MPPSNKPQVSVAHEARIILKNAVALIWVNMVCEWVMIGSGFTTFLQINLKQRFITFKWHSSEYCLTIFFSFVLVIGTQGGHSNHLFTEFWVCFSSLLTNWNSLHICILKFCSVYSLLLILFSYTRLLFFYSTEIYSLYVASFVSTGPNNCSFSSCGLNCNDEIIAAATEPYGEDVCLYLW